jgi:hypothetical protein
MDTMGRIFETKKVIMKWFKRWFARKVTEAIAYDQDDHFDQVPTPKMSSRRGLLSTVSRSHDIDSEDGLNITVRSAIGGRIITFRRYDNRNDTNHYKLYVIHDELDFDKELGKIITLESMCQRA